MNISKQCIATVCVIKTGTGTYLMMEGSWAGYGAGSVLVTDESGCGSGRPKNTRIRWFLAILTCHFNLLRKVDAPVSVEIVVAGHVAQCQVVVWGFHLERTTRFQQFSCFINYRTCGLFIFSNGAHSARQLDIYWLPIWHSASTRKTELKWVNILEAGHSWGLHYH
jgi:hypothetical protein